MFVVDCFGIVWWLVNSVVFMFFFILYTFVLLDRCCVDGVLIV